MGIIGELGIWGQWEIGRLFNCLIVGLWYWVLRYWGNGGIGGLGHWGIGGFGKLGVGEWGCGEFQHC